MHSDRAMATERQRGTQAALFRAEHEPNEITTEYADSAEERQRIVERQRQRWALVQRLAESG